MRLSLSVLLLLTLSSLSAAFNSNALGMDMGFKEALDGIGYEGETEGDTTTIYKDGDVVLVRVSNSNGYLVRESGREERVITDSSGRRLSRTLTENGRTERTVYEYDGDRLASQTVVTEDGISRRIEYIDNTDGLLAGHTGDKTALYDVSFFLYEAEDGLVRVSFQGGEETEAPSSYELSEDGAWVSDGKEYGSDGLLRERTENGVTESFLYDESGLLVEKHVEDASSLTVFHYSEGELTQEDQYEGGEMTKSYDRSDPRSVVETRYENGEPSYRITYDSDGKRIRRVENLR